MELCGCASLQKLLVAILEIPLPVAVCTREGRCLSSKVQAGSRLWVVIVVDQGGK